MTVDEAYNLLVDHNCGGKCPCEQCKEAGAIMLERNAAKQEPDLLYEDHDADLCLHCDNAEEWHSEVSQVCPGARDTTTTYQAIGPSLLVYTDGGSRGNPGPSASAFYAPELKLSKGIYIGHRTNNEAEYCALIFALETLIEMGYQAIRVRTDSKLMANQVNRKWVCNNSTPIYPLYLRVGELLNVVHSFHIEHVKRDKNTEADAEVNRVLDAL